MIHRLNHAWDKQVHLAHTGSTTDSHAAGVNYLSHALLTWF